MLEKQWPVSLMSVIKMRPLRLLEMEYILDNKKIVEIWVALLFLSHDQEPETDRRFNIYDVCSTTQ